MPTPQELESVFSAGKIVGPGLPSRYKEKEAPPLPPYKFKDIATPILEFIPAGKYLIPENVEEFKTLNEDDKAAAVGFEGLGFLTIAFPPLRGLRGLNKVDDALRFAAKSGVKKKGFLSRIYEAVHPSRKAMPIEDLASWEIKHYRPEAEKVLLKKGFSKPEAKAIVEEVHGAPALNQHRLEAAWKKQKLTETWKAHIKPTGEPYGKLGVSNEIKQALKPASVRRSGIESTYHGRAKEILGGNADTEKAFEAVYKKSFRGKPKMLSEATDAEIATISRDMLKDPDTYAKIGNVKKAGYFQPTRIVYGMGEKVHKTFSRIYEPVRKSVRKTNEHTLAKVNLFRQMLEDRGLGQVIKKGGALHFKPAPEFTQAVKEEAYKHVRWADDMMGRAYQGKLHVDEARRIIADKKAQLVAKNQVVGKVVNAHYDFMDHMYGERMGWKIKNLFDKEDMTVWGRVAIEKKLEELAPKIKEAFSTGSEKSMTSKLHFIDETLDKMRQFIDDFKDVAFNPHSAGMYRDGVEATTPFAGLKLKSELTRGRRGTWLPYHEYYSPRIAQVEQREMSKVFEMLSGDKTPFYAKARVSPEMHGKAVDFESAIHTRIRSQSKEMHLYDTLTDVANYAKNLPDSWKNYTGHHLARVLSLPSALDDRLAGMLGKSKLIKSISKMFGQSNTWDAYRVRELAKTINDFTYMGYLGFKPFSAMRNLFQPLLTVPADLGGIKNFYSLAKGYARLRDPKTIRYLDDIGIITDYAPEISTGANILNIGRRVSKNLVLPERQKVRDFAMWMFRGSDMTNRYVSGAAAMHRWEAAAKAIPNPQGNVRGFLKSSGTGGRHEWVRHEIEGHIRAGRIDEAKKIFVKDVVSDTQYLYGGIDAPIINQAGGFFGKTAAVFQSWWMNYGSLLEKWYLTGELDKAGSRMFPWMMSSAIAYQLMEPMWGGFIARKSTLIGPLPGGSGIMEAAMTGRGEAAIPSLDPMEIAKGFPTFLPVAHALDLTMKAGSLLIAGEGENQANLKAVQKQAYALVKATASVTGPGGSQAFKMIEGTRQEGFTGFSKSILSLR